MKMRGLEKEEKVNCKKEDREEKRSQAGGGKVEDRDRGGG